MKKFYFIGAAALAAMTMSCSKTDNQPEGGIILDPNAPVEVTFNTPTISVETKAIDPETFLVEGSSAAGLEVGVYGLETDQAGNLIWDSADETTSITDLVNRNVTVSEDGKINFDDPDVYYPVSSDKTFSFYGYYPYNPDATAETDACTVTYDLTVGNVDILYASAYATALTSAGTGQYGFNAAYIRRLLRVQGDHPYLPSFRFQHKLTALEFVASPKAGEDVGAAMQVVGFELVNVDTQVRLTIASTLKDDCGKIEGLQQGSLSAGDNLAITPVEEGAPIHTFTLVPGDRYEAVITISRDGIPQEPVTVDVTTAATDGTFKPGTKYTMNIVIRSPLEVEIFTTEVEDWVEVDGGEIEI